MEESDLERKRRRARESMARWRAANPERSRENQRRWVEANRERDRAKHKRYRENNPESNKAKQDRYWATAIAKSYSGAHKALNAQRGRAKDHACGCGEPAFDWALNRASAADIRLQPHGTDKGYGWSPNIWDYEPMCRPCHRKFDNEERRNR